MRVSESRRLRRFSATYAMAYVVVVLIMNYIGRLSLFKGVPMSYIFTVVNLIVQTPLLFGFVRGAVTREYDFAKGLTAYVETDKYPFYLAYICVNAAFDIVYSLTGMIGGSFGTVLSVIMIVLRFPVKFLLVGIFFGAIFADSKKPHFSVSEIIKNFSEAVSRAPFKMLVPEIFMMVVSYLSLYIAAMLAELLPAHWIVSYVLTCCTTVQFGFIVISWPIYYLYCKSAYGITAYEEPRGRKLD